MDVKVVLTLTIPGAVMVTQELAKVAPKENLETTIVSVQEKDKKGNYKKKEALVVKTRRTKDCVQKIRLSREAYDFMLETPVSPKLIARWKSARRNERLRYHLDEIAKHFNAKSYDFEILED